VDYSALRGQHRSILTVLQVDWFSVDNSTAHRQTKKKNKKSLLRIFENFFCQPAFGTFAFARFLFFS
jgi:hypothetical protein